MAGLLFLPEFPQACLMAHVKGLQLLVTVTSLLTDMEGNIPPLAPQRPRKEEAQAEERV